MEVIKTKVGYVTFAFRDEDGDEFARFKINHTDPRLMSRCKNIADFFADVSKGNVKDVTNAEELEAAIQDKFCSFLGYDCRESLFGRVAAMDVMADGRTFAHHVLDVLVQKVGAEIAKRRRENIQKYTGKYV